jgi:hypothetical protein
MSNTGCERCGGQLIEIDHYGERLSVVRVGAFCHQHRPDIVLPLNKELCLDLEARRRFRDGYKGRGCRVPPGPQFQDEARVSGGHRSTHRDLHT